MKIGLLVLCSLGFSSFLFAQNALPYRQIPDYPEDYSSGSILSRMIDGLGYRYYWASEGLREEDLAYKPSEEGRTSLETLEHIYGLSLMVLNAIQNTPNVRSEASSEYSFSELREKTLLTIQKASELVKGKTAQELATHTVSFQNGEKTVDFPLWHILNGPLADALTHVGQIVSFRRSSGNPQNPKVSVFSGKTGN